MLCSKPIIRWNIGAVSYIGFDCLQQAYLNLRELYGDSVDYAVTLNSQVFRTPAIMEIEQAGVEIVSVLDEHFSLGAVWQWGECWSTEIRVGLLTVPVGHVAETVDS